MSNKDRSGLNFIIKTLIVYGVWMVVRKAMKGIDFLNPFWIDLNNYLAKLYIDLAVPIINPLIGETVKYNARNIIIKGTEGLYVGDHCLGVSAMFIFTLLIAVLNGKWWHKILYIFSGLGVIFLVNLSRVVGLALMLKNGSKAFFHFNHSYTYLVLVYGIIFAMIILWEKKIAPLAKDAPRPIDSKE